MRSFFTTLQRTVVSGFFLLLPLSVVVIILLKVISITYPLTAKLSAALGVHGVSGVRLLMIGVLLLVCLLAGMLVRSRRVSGFRDWLERNVLSMLPGYEYIRMRMSDTLTEDEHATDRAIFVRIDDGWSPAILVERAPDGRCVVFVPDVPNPKTGSVYIVNADQVRHMNVKHTVLERCLRSHGKGLMALDTTSQG